MGGLAGESSARGVEEGWLSEEELGVRLPRILSIGGEIVVLGLG